MDKMKMKTILKQIKRDVEYYTKEYDLSQKEAYTILYEKHYISMRLIQAYVEVEERERIHNSFKEDKK